MSRGGLIFTIVWIGLVIGTIRVYDATIGMEVREESERRRAAMAEFAATCRTALEDHWSSRRKGGEGAQLRLNDLRLVDEAVDLSLVGDRFVARSDYERAIEAYAYESTRRPEIRPFALLQTVRCLLELERHAVARSIVQTLIEEDPAFSVRGIRIAVWAACEWAIHAEAEATDSAEPRDRRRGNSERERAREMARELMHEAATEVPLESLRHLGRLAEQAGLVTLEDEVSRRTRLLSTMRSMTSRLSEGLVAIEGSRGQTTSGARTSHRLWIPIGGAGPNERPDEVALIDLDRFVSRIDERFRSGGGDGLVGDFTIEWVHSDDPTPTSDSSLRLASTFRGIDLVVEDRGFDQAMQQLEGRRSQLRWIGIVVGGVVLIAGMLSIVAYDRQRRLAALKLKLLANVSHELKTPVTSIRIFGELLTDERLDPERSRHFGKRIQAEARRLGQRIEDILETARGEARPPVREMVDVSRIVHEVVDRFEIDAEERCCTLVRLDGGEPGDRQPALVMTDPDAIDRIVSNLLDNAAKYGRADDGERAVVEVGCGVRDDGVEISVRDRGPGIPPRDRQRIFEPFTRLQFERYDAPGVGLGLSISSQLAKRIGGNLRVDDAKPGARFILSLPRDRSRSAIDEEKAA